MLLQYRQMSGGKTFNMTQYMVAPFFLLTHTPTLDCISHGSIVLNSRQKDETIHFYFLNMAVSMDSETRVDLFKSIGLNEQKARETLKNPDVTRLLETTINEVRK
jgi:hypothetical protein